MKKYFSLFWAVFILLSCVNKPKDTALNLKILSYNLHHCNPPHQEGLIDVESIAGFIQEVNADLVALQEIDVNTARSGRIDQAGMLAKLSGYPYYYFSKTIDYDGGEYGIMLMSKFPVSDLETYRLPTDSLIGGEPRAMATGIVSLKNGLKIRFASTHLDAEQNNSSRILQIKEILRYSDKITIPFIIAGDFNAAENNKVIEFLDTYFGKSCSECPDTFSEEGESGTLDYVAFRPAEKFNIVSHTVLDGVKLSDHFPVIVELQIK